MTSLVENLARASNSVNAEADLELAPLKLTTRRLIVMTAIASTTPIRATDITRLTGIDRSTTGMMVQTLLDLGYVVRTRPEGDFRSWVVSLTPAGKKALKAGQKIIDKFEANLAKSIGPVAADAMDHHLRLIAGVENSLVQATG